MNSRKTFLLISMLFINFLTPSSSDCLNKTIRTELWLVRHGQTNQNLYKQNLMGNNDPLNATGTQQAQATATYFAQEHALKKFAAVYSSDLVRAQTTAQIIADKMGIQPVHIEMRLREQESYNDQVKTDQLVATALKDIVKQHKGQRVIIVTHGGVLKGIFKSITRMSQQKNSEYIKPANACISLITVKDGVWTIKQWATTNHLKKSDVSKQQHPAKSAALMT